MLPLPSVTEYSRDPAQASAFRFLLKFAVLVLAGYAVLAIPAVDRVLYRVLELTADAAAALLGLIGHEITVTGTVIRSPQFTVTIMRGCDGVEPTLILWAAMVSVRRPLTQKLIGLILSLVLLQVLNLARIVTLFEVGINWPTAFHSLHVEVWPAIFILVELGFFLIWSRWSMPRTVES